MLYQRKSPPDRYRRYTPEELDRMRQLRYFDTSYGDIALELTRSVHSVRRTCAVHNIKSPIIKGGPHSPEFEEKVRYLTRSRVPTREISRQVGISYSALVGYCRRHGISVAEYRRIPKEFVNDVRRLAQLGFTRRRIAQELKTDVIQIHNICKNYKISTRQGKSGPPSQKERLLLEDIFTQVKKSLSAI